VEFDPRSDVLDPYREMRFDITVVSPKTTPSSFYKLQLVLDYGPIQDTYNITLYVMEVTTGGGGGGGGGDDGGLLTTDMMMVLLVVVLVVIVIAVLLVRGGRGGTKELDFEEEYSPGQRPLPPPPPPQAQPVQRPLPPPPPPPKPPETVEELLSDTSVMERVSDEMDRYSADSQYASGATLAEEGEPFFVGDCPKCGNKVMEYPSGTLMCSGCGSQFEEG
jgi:hypothetical protein